MDVILNVFVCSIKHLKFDELYKNSERYCNYLPNIGYIHENERKLSPPFIKTDKHCKNRFK